MKARLHFPSSLFLFLSFSLSHSLLALFLALFLSFFLSPAVDLDQPLYHPFICLGCVECAEQCDANSHCLRVTWTWPMRAVSAEGDGSDDAVEVFVCINEPTQSHAWLCTPCSHHATEMVRPHFFVHIDPSAFQLFL
jgi:hypothetical protein